MSKSGRLFVVATPIGNLDDISPRALDTLRTVHAVAAEDTRHSMRLLEHFGIRTPLISYHEHNEISRSKEFVERMRGGEDIALITDAGTPCISDPGYRIVRAAHDEGIQVIAIPGPSSIIAALSISGLPTDSFAFHGFFPRKLNEARATLKRVESWSGVTHIFLEAPNRLKSTLEIIGSEQPGRQVAVCRELTKIYEEAITGTVEEVLSHFAESDVRGECVLLVHIPRAEGAAQELSDSELRERVDQVIDREGLTRRDAIRRVSERLGVSRNRVYSAATGQEPETE